ncbi:uncharacterized protein ACBT57_004831 [Dama dama]
MAGKIVDSKPCLLLSGFGFQSQTPRNPRRSQASSATAPKGTCWSLQIESCSDCHAAEDVLGLDPNYVTFVKIPLNFLRNRAFDCREQSVSRYRARCDPARDLAVSTWTMKGFVAF